MENNTTIIELEDFVFSVKEKPGAAAGTIADIIGVLIGLKPAMLADFDNNELNTLEMNQLEEILNKLDLEKVFFEHSYLLNNKKIKSKMFCISKKIKLARKTQKAFIKLWSTMSDEGEILKRRSWVKTTKKIGKLLGYPKTAVDNFVKEDNIEDEDRVKRMKRNRYYVHSAKYEDKEFKSYDQILNMAISDFAPKTTNYLVEDKNKRWLS